LSLWNRGLAADRDAADPHTVAANTAIQSGRILIEFSVLMIWMWRDERGVGWGGMDVDFRGLRQDKGTGRTSCRVDMTRR